MLVCFNSTWPCLCLAQVVTEYDNTQLSLVLTALERMSHHLTAAVVSNDIHFVQQVLGSTVNGTTYCGIRGRTTGTRDWTHKNLIAFVESLLPFIQVHHRTIGLALPEILVGLA
jgi:hypothetical protein